MLLLVSVDFNDPVAQIDYTVHVHYWWHNAVQFYPAIIAVVIFLGLVTINKF